MADLKDGESCEVKGSAAKPYVLRNIGGVYSCSCPAWRNQSVPIERRTCKHLRKLRGDAAEQQRVGGELATPARKAAAKDKDSPPLLLAQSWDNALDLSGWWMSEKLDGVRAYWDGTQFLSRQGNVYHAPDWFVAGLPDTPLDGELWIDRKKFQRTVSIVRRQDKSELWKEVKYLVFDAPQCEGEFEQRYEFLNGCLRRAKLPYAQLHQHQRCRNVAHLQQQLDVVEAQQGEGLMLRQPGSLYEVGRSATLLKVKRFHDAEAIVLDHQKGKGKFKGMLGALVVQLPDGTEFSVGTGLSDAQRSAPPPVGSTITFRYQELSDAGVPRFPSFVRLHTNAPADGTAATGPATKKTKKPSAATPASKGKGKKAVRRYFENSSGSSNKFWEVTVADHEVTVRYGRIGSQGTTKVHSCDGHSAAQQKADKLIEEKTSKGYAEKDA